VAILAATLFTFTHKLEIADESAPVVPVDLVTIAPKTNLMAQARPEPRIKPDFTPPAFEPKQLKVEPPTVPQETEPAPVETPHEIVVPAPTPAPKPKAQPQEKPQESKKFSVDNVLALLNKVSPQQSAQTAARESTRNVTAFGAQNAMTADLQDALRSQIRPCWSPPIGAPHPEELVVDFDLFLNPDGSVAQPPQLTGDSAAAVARNPYVRAAKDAAERAIYECAPYKLPAGQYSVWREINPFRFDPRQMAGD
jgi:hypothetical protein